MIPPILEPSVLDGSSWGTSGHWCKRRMAKHYIWRHYDAWDQSYTEHHEDRIYHMDSFQPNSSWHRCEWCDTDISYRCHIPLPPDIPGSELEEIPEPRRYRGWLHVPVSERQRIGRNLAAKRLGRIAG